MTTLKLSGIAVEYVSRDRAPVDAVAGVDLTVESGYVMGLVGESGCGKSSLARAAVGLTVPARGEVRVDGRPLPPLGRGGAGHRPVQLIFQNPYASLNPRRRVGSQIADGLRRAGVDADRDRRAQVVQLLERVGLEADSADRYPHEFSGGQRQRIAITRALAAGPRIIIADEPFSALDASAQAQIIEFFGTLRAQLGLGLLLISHNLAVIHHVADVAAVMYLGVIVEVAPTEALWERPFHPYTEALIASVPRLAEPGVVPPALSGEVPDPSRPPVGCRFHPRCPYAFDRCRAETPPLREVERGRTVACWLQEGTAPAPPAEHAQRRSGPAAAEPDARA